MLNSTNKQAARFVNLKIANTAYIQDVTISENYVTGLGLPLENNDAANKEYVDDSIVNLYTRTEVNSNNYTLTTNDDIVSVLYTPTGPVNLTLPKIDGKKQYTIVDEGGNAGNNSITISANVLDTIIGQNSYIINSNYNAVKIYNNETNSWFVR